MVSRRNAMLTTEDRRWLTGRKEYEGEHAKQQRYQRRRDIQERIYNSVLDWTILFEHLEERQRTELFEGVVGTRDAETESEDEPRDDEPGNEPRDDEFYAGLRDALAFVLYNTGIVDAMGAGHASETLAEQLLFEAVYRAGQREGILVEDVDLEITAFDRSASAVLEDLKAGRPLTPAELRLVLESGEVETARVQECVRELLMQEETADSTNDGDDGE